MWGLSEVRPRAAYFAVGVAALPFVGLLPHTPQTKPVPREPIPAEAILTVAPDGSGVDCTPAKPCSIATAQAQARKIAPTSRYDTVVEFQDGTYRLSRTVRLTQQDSGRNGHEMVYRAAKGAHPVLSGGESVTGWKKVKGSKNWYVDIAKDFDTRQLYVDGHRMQLARGLEGKRMVLTPTGMISTAPEVASWKNPSNIQAVFRGGNGPWTQTQCPVEKVEALVITMVQPCWDNLHFKAMGVQELAWFNDPFGGFGGLAPWKTPTYFENVYSAMGPGTWTIDRVAHKLYYQPKGNADPNKQHVVVPALQTLLEVDGSPRHPVHDLTVQGLTFAYGTWTAINSPDGFAQMQADWHLKGKNAPNHHGTCTYTNPPGTCPFASWARTPANVVFKSTSHVTIRGNKFVHLGGAGLDLYEGAKHDLVEGNEFTDIAATGIQLGATDDPLPEKKYGGMRERFNTITNNFVHHVANQYLGGIGIWLGYTTHSRVTHNEIDHVPYTAISIGWGGWHANVLDPERNPNGNAYNRVSNNLMYDYMHTLGDGGAIYSNGPQADSWKTALYMTRNVAYRGTNNDFSFYTDAASRYVKVGGNFAYFQPIDSFATGGCHTVGHIRIYNNYFAQGGPAYPCFLYEDMVKENNNTTVCEVPMPEEAPQPIMRGAGLQPQWRHLVRQYRPEVNLVGPEQITSSGRTIMISGRGFTPDSKVYVGGRLATGVRVLTTNFIFAKAPANQTGGTVPVVVTNAQGRSAVTEFSQVTYTQQPLPCQLGMGTGISTAILS